MATARLRKKVLQGEQNNQQFGNLLESFVSFGTALPSLDSTAAKDKNEFVPVWEQTVTDEQGRRRFHGAFEGGFSAGHFNTVGSKEGWTPTAFVSSRSTRAAKDPTQSTAELAKGLMDDEDLAELAASRTLTTASAYSNPSAAYDPLLGNIPSPQPIRPTAALASLIEPSSGRIGLKLMRKMGWREGQGVGPRVTFDRRKDMAKELGIVLPEDEEEGDGGAAKHYYAPIDRPLTTLTEVGIASDRGWGLGYVPNPSIAQASAAGPSSRGLSSVEMDEDEVYGAGSSGFDNSNGSKKRNWVVDLEQDDGADNYTIRGTGHRRPDAVANKKSKSTAQMETFHDNTPVIPGFRIKRDDNAVASTSRLPAAPPRGWEPDPQRVLNASAPPNDHKGKGRQLDADQRGDLLGEPQPPPVPKSVFDYMSAKSRERLALLSANPSSFTPGTSTNSTPLTGTRVPILPPPEPDAPLHIPLLDGPTALAALSGFQPFAPSSTAADPVRQVRYTLYLQLQAKLLPPSSVPSTLPFGPRNLPNGSTQTIKELNKELDDYARAAKVFKPVSGMLAGRFTSGGAGVVTGQMLEMPVVAPGLSQPKPKPPPPTTDDNPIIDERNLTTAQSAARAGMFGRLTRTVDEFRPAKLVCKRFGVRNPFPDIAQEDEEDQVGGAWKEAGRGAVGGSRKAAGEVLGKASMDQLMQASGFRKFESAAVSTERSLLKGENVAEEKKVPSGNEGVEKVTLANVGLGDDEAQGAETFTYTKAPADIFAAVFAETDDEEEEEEDDFPPIIPVSKPVPTPASTSTLALPTPTIDSAAPSIPIAPPPALEIPLSIDNLASYRPSFVPTTSHAPKTDIESSKSSAKKKSSKRKAPPKSSLSFDVDEGEAEVESFVKVKAEKKKKVKREEKVVEEEWVEVPSLIPLSNPVLPKEEKSNGRVRASELF